MCLANYFKQVGENAQKSSKSFIAGALTGNDGQPRTTNNTYIMSGFKHIADKGGYMKRRPSNIDSMKSGGSQPTGKASERYG